MVRVFIFRLGHRIRRDVRIATHIALAARALGASAVFYSGERDTEMEKSVSKVVKNWGGPFEVKYVQGWRAFIKKFKGERIHLTMYGLPFEKNLKKLKQRKDKLVIVGGQKVPAEVYGLADFNFSVTSQPHSEVAALAIFLNSVAKRPKLRNAKRKIIPQAQGKRVESLSKRKMRK